MRIDAVDVDTDLKKIPKHKQRRVGFVKFPETEIYALRGDTVEVECELFSEEDNVLWTINNQPLEKHLRANRKDYGFVHKLYIKDVTPNDNGTKICVTSGNETFTSILVIEEIPVTFVKKLESKYVGILNQEINLEAQLSHEAEIVKWYFNDKEISFDKNNCKISFNGLNHSLMLKNLNYNMIGSYSVQADRAKSSTVVEIYGSPIITNKKDCVNISVDAQDDILFLLNFKALPKPEFQLFFKNVEIPLGIRTKYDVKENEIVIRHQNALKSDRGSYQIRVFNNYGEDFANFEVFVRDVPEAPTDFFVKEIGNDYVVVAWSKVIDDGGSPITEYIVEKKGANRRQFQKAGQISSNSHEMFVEDLNIETDYVFRVAAINRFGIGEFSKFLKITTGTPYNPPLMKSKPFVSAINKRNSYYRLTPEISEQIQTLQKAEKTCRLNWEECVDSGGSPLYGYDVYIRESGSENWNKLNDETVFTNTYVVENYLNDKATYEFKVEAINQAGLHSNSNLISDKVVLSKLQPDYCYKLKMPTVNVIQNNCVTLDWEISSINVSYIIKYRIEGSNYWNKILVETAPAVIENLKENVSYIFKIATKDANGNIGEFSEETDPIKITSCKKPTITKKLKNITVSKKDELQFDCCATGEPTPVYAWFKDDNEIGLNDKEYSISNQGYMSSLKIASVNESHIGTYKCVVSNEHGFETSVGCVNVSDVRAHFVRSFAEKIELVEGEKLILECEISDNEATVIWEKNKRLLTNSNSVIIEEIGCIRRLTINNVLKKNFGHYVCKTIDEQNSCETDVTIKEEEAQIKINLQDICVTEFGKKVVLNCELTKNTSEVKWLKNNSEIWQQSGKYFPLMLENECLATLEIFNFNEKDVGEYTLLLPNGEKSAPANVKLEIPPKIEFSKEIKENEEIVLHVGKDLYFEATLSGWPKPNCESLFNTEFLNKIATSYEEFDNVINVRIKNLKKIHNGQIIFKANNLHGTVTKQFKLCVLDVPYAPKNLTVTKISAKTVALNWMPSFEEFDFTKHNDYVVDYYIIERKSAKNSRWRQVAILRNNNNENKQDIAFNDQKPLKYVTDELFDNEIYTFRIFAVNGVGKSKPSNYCEFETPNTNNTVNENILPSVSSFQSDFLLLETPKNVVAKCTDNIKVKLNWDNVENAALYGIERQKIDDDENLWLEIANTDRNSFVDRSILETGKYVYRITAKLPGVGSSLKSLETQAVFVIFKSRNSVSCLSESTNDSSQTCYNLNSLESNSSSFTKSLSNLSYDCDKYLDNKLSKNASPQLLNNFLLNYDSDKKILKDEKKTNNFKIKNYKKSKADVDEDQITPINKELNNVNEKKELIKTQNCFNKENTKNIVLDNTYPTKISVEEDSFAEITVGWISGNVEKCTWFKDNKLLNSKLWTFEYSKSICWINNAVKSDNGMYMCILENNFGESVNWMCELTVLKKKNYEKFESLQLHEDVNLFKKKTNSAPVVRVALPTMQEFTENKTNVSLNCAFDGQPLPNIFWYKDNKQLFSNNEIEILCENGFTTLLIKKIKPEHYGVYTCEGINEYGTCQSSCFINIKSEKLYKSLSRFEEPLTDRSVTINCELVLECKFTKCRPLPTVTWYKNDVLLSLDSNRLLATQDSQGLIRLTILNTTLTDSGKYMCHAQNIKGSDFTQCFVNVFSIDESTSKINNLQLNNKIFAEELVDQDIEIGSDMLLKCAISMSLPSNLNFEKLRVTWKHNNLIIRSFLNRRFLPKFDQTTGIATLNIFSTELKDSGTYSCIITFGNDVEFVSKCNINILPNNFIKAKNFD